MTWSGFSISYTECNEIGRFHWNFENYIAALCWREYATQMGLPKYTKNVVPGRKNQCFRMAAYSPDLKDHKQKICETKLKG